MNSTYPSRHIAVIGAGMAGLACARELREHGHRVTMFDKGRSPGGRIASRRDGVVSYAHGAQFVTAHHEAFGKLLGQLALENHIAAWPAASKDEKVVWVGTPGMSALPRAMADELRAKGVTIHADTHVGWIGEDRSLTVFPSANASPGFVSRLGGESTTRFDAVAIAIPSPQAITLLAAIGHRFTTSLAQTRYAPCWALMLSFADGCDAPDTISPTDSPLAWIARNASRPGQNAVPETWVVHASADWSRAQLEEPADEAARLMLSEFARITGQFRTPNAMRAHRWRYALVEQALGQACLWDSEMKLGLAGDYCLGPRVEAAFDSGCSLARAIMASLGEERRVMEREV